MKRYMTINGIMREIERWVEKGKPPVWVKNHSSKYPEWELTQNLPLYCNTTLIVWVIEDEYSEIYKAYYDGETLQLRYGNCDWDDFGGEDAITPLRSIERDRWRVKPKEWYETEEAKGKPVWVSNYPDSWYTDIFVTYKKDANFKFICKNSGWKYAKPVKPEDCYKGENNV